MTDYRTKLLIIGSGPAGYTAAIYAARANIKPMIVEGMQPGGQLTMTTMVENFPGFTHGIDGPVLMETMKQQCINLGVEIVMDRISQVDLSKPPFSCQSDFGHSYTADSIIIATGAQAKWLGLPSEAHYLGFGVSSCATCDGFFYKNKSVAVVGGGNTAVEEALYLTNHAAKVYLIHRRDKLRADKTMQDRVMKNPKIEMVWNHEVVEVCGREEPKEVTSLRIQNTQNGEASTLTVDGLFVAIGHSPSTEVFKEYLTLDDEGYIACPPGTTFTNIQGVFAAGDVQDKIYRQAITAAGQGCMAALDAERYLSDREQDEQHYA